MSGASSFFMPAVTHHDVSSSLGLRGEDCFLLVSLLLAAPDFNALLDLLDITLNSLFELFGVELLFRVQIIS